MPAEIDTGGSTVLHCDYRAADCPIVLSAFGENFAGKQQRQEDSIKCSLVPHRHPGRRNPRDSYYGRRKDRSYRPTRGRILYHQDNEEESLPHETSSPPPPTSQEVLLSSCRRDKNQSDYQRPFDLTDETKRRNIDGRFEPISDLPCIRLDEDISRSWNEPSKDSRDILRTKETYEKESSLYSSHHPPRELVETIWKEQGSSSKSSRKFGERRKVLLGRKRRSSYVSLALILFLAIFGHNGIFKPCVLNSGARLTFFAIGTLINVANGAPLDLIGDFGSRAERSANLSHITGTSRKILMYIKNRYLQILPDGTVNGSNNDTSEYMIFQRSSVSVGQLRIQSVATCLYLCMDSCGLLYGSREFTEDCVFKETIEMHNYNTYSSVRWSTAKKTLYLGLDRRGRPRRVQAKGHNLGRLSSFATVLTHKPSEDQVEQLERRMKGAKHNLRHSHNGSGRLHHRAESKLPQHTACPHQPPAQEKDGRDRFRCRKRNKRKKRKRRCKVDEEPGPNCERVVKAAGSAISEATRSQGIKGSGSSSNGRNETSLQSKRSCESAASEEACRREALSASSKKRKSRIDEQKQKQLALISSVAKEDDQIDVRNTRNNISESIRNDETAVERGGQSLDSTKNPNGMKTKSGSRAPPGQGQRGKIAEEERDYQNDSNNGKNKANEARSSAFSPKIAIAGNNSQSKKPDLTDGKKRKRKGTASRTNGGGGGGGGASQRQRLYRKRFVVVGESNKHRRDEVPGVTLTTVQPLSTVSSLFLPQPSGTSSVPSIPPAQLVPRKNKNKSPSSPINEVTSSHRIISPTSSSNNRSHYSSAILSANPQSSSSSRILVTLSQRSFYIDALPLNRAIKVPENASTEAFPAGKGNKDEDGLLSNDYATEKNGSIVNGSSVVESLEDMIGSSSTIDSINYDEATSGENTEDDDNNHDDNNNNDDDDVDDDDDNNNNNNNNNNYNNDDDGDDNGDYNNNSSLVLSKAKLTASISNAQIERLLM